MNNALRTLEDDELFLYTLTEQFPPVRRSTVTQVGLGASLARVEGKLHFDRDVRPVVREWVLYHRLSAVMDD